MRPANGGKAGQDIKVTYGREAAGEAEGPPEKTSPLKNTKVKNVKM